MDTEVICGKLNMDDFNIVFGKKDKCTDRQRNIKDLKTKYFDNRVTLDLWEYTNERCSLHNISTQDKLAVYNLCGSLCHKMLKRKIHCQNCKGAFSNRIENLIEGLEEASYVTENSLRGLIHPNIHLFNFCVSLENMFAWRIEKQMFGSMFGNICKELSDANCTFPCKEHGSEMLATIAYDYLIMRMRQFARFYKKLQDSSSKEKRKSAKHEDT